MGKESINTLLLENDPEVLRMMQDVLGGTKSPRFHLETADRLAEGLERLAKGGIDLVLLDLSLTDSQGFDTFAKVRSQAPQIPIVVLTALSDETLAVKALQQGAQDYLVKGRVEAEGLIHSMRYAIERKRYEEALRESEERYRLLVDFSPEPMFVQTQGKFVYVNAALTRMLAAESPERLLGRPVLDFVHPDSRETFRRQLQPFVEKRSKVRLVEQKLVALNGKPIDVELASIPISYHGDFATQFVLRDITERKRHLAAQEESEKLFHSLADCSPVLLWMSDARKAYTFVNQTWLHFTGRNLSEELGFGWKQGLHPEDVRPYEDAVSRAYQARRSFRVDYRLRRSDGEFRWMMDVGSPRYLPDGQFVGYIGSSLDVTEQKLAEEDREQLLAREKAAHAEAEAAQWRFAFLAEASTLLTSSLDYSTTLERVARLAVPYLADWCIVDMAGDDRAIRRLAVAHVDPAKVRLAKTLERRYPTNPDSPYGPAKVLRTGLSEIYPTVPDSVLVAIAHDPGHLAVLRKLGLRSVMSVPLTARGRTLGVLTFASAESGRHYTSADLALAEDLAARAALAVDNARLYSDAREAIRAREQFISVASHELRTPITVIQGYTQLLIRILEKSGHFPVLESVPGHPDGFGAAQMMGYLKSIERSTFRLNRLIEDLLDLSRVQNRGMTLTRERMNLSELLANVIESVRIREMNNPSPVRLAWEMVLPEEGHVFGMWDKSRVEQVLVNLTENAVKYSPPGGRVTVTLRVEKSAADDTTGFAAHLSLQDQGIGIPPPERTKIFEPFFRATNIAGAGKTVPGLGLGLSVSKEIVDLHSGKIWVESEGANQGSTFHVVLPGAALEKFAAKTPVPAREPAVEKSKA
jgi:PAS domain S-box-containing protein